MVKLLTRDYLSKRLFIALAAFVVSMALIAAVGVHALFSFQAYSRFSTIFTELFEVTTRLETEIGWSVAQRSTPERAANLSGRYRDALAVFSALRMSDHDREEASDLRWSVLETEYRIDPQAERRRVGLRDGGMPDDLHRLWHDQANGTESLGDLVAEFLSLGQILVEKRREGYSAEHLRIAETLHNFSQTRLFPAFHNAAQSIAVSTERNANYSFYLLMACAAAGILGTVLTGFLMFRPLQGAVLESQDHLLRQRDQARASEQGNRDFLAVMSHELRTPMNGVIGFTDILLATPLTPQQKEHAHSIKESGQALIELLNGILELARIESGPLQLEDADFSPTALVDEVVTMLGPQANAKRLDLAAFVDPALPERLRGDPGRIRQILVHLVGNAVKFTVSGGVAIEVRHEGGGNADGHTVHFCVTDTGIGIPKGQIEKIFQRFTQMGSAESRNFEGSGLGLSICRELAKQMGGKVSVESTPDKGSTFSLWLKLSAARPPAATIADRSRISFAGRRFLVVDDNSLNRRVFRLQLESHGAEVECVPDAEAALAALTRSESYGNPFDLVVIDQVMPGSDGLALRKSIRERPQHARLKLIIASSGGIGHDQQARALGFDAACPKPVLQDGLIAKVHELMTPDVDSLAAAPVILLPAKTGDIIPAEPRERQLRLLVAEDNPINQRLFVTALKHAGFAVDVANDGQEALNAVQRHNYDLVLMDIRMPVMNGVEATKRIRALPIAAAKLPIIAMTANAMVGDREEYLTAGMDDYVAKPIDFNILLTKIRAHLPISVVDVVPSVADVPLLSGEKKTG